MKTAVLLMAYGGPDSLEDIGPYLLDVRGGRPTSPELVAEISERYLQIGGRSPLREITQAQRQCLEAQLKERGIRVYVGMRHWKPYIADVVRQIAADGCDQIIGLCMAPHASRYSTGAYRAKLYEAASALPETIQVRFVESWHDQPHFIRSLAENARAALAQFPAAQRGQVHFLFSAHSLPASIVEQGDPYAAQIAETASLVAEELGLRPDQWSQCYQSAGRIPGAWLGPQIDAVIPELAEKGVRQVLVQAVGFVADHVEVLYDIDIEAQAQAEKHGMTLRRAASPNTAPEFIAGLAQIVNETLQKDE